LSLARFSSIRHDADPLEMCRLKNNFEHLARTRRPQKRKNLAIGMLCRLVPPEKVFFAKPVSPARSFFVKALLIALGKIPLDVLKRAVGTNQHADLPLREGRRPRRIGAGRFLLHERRQRSSTQWARNGVGLYTENSRPDPGSFCLDQLTNRGREVVSDLGIKIEDSGTSPMNIASATIRKTKNLLTAKTTLLLVSYIAAGVNRHLAGLDRFLGRACSH
jgi:hypothetical protein